MLQGRLRAGDDLEDDDVTDNTHVVLPSNVNHDTLAQLNEQGTLSNPVATIDQNDLDSSEESRGGGIQQFDHFTQRTSGLSEKLAKLKVAVTTLGPDRATRNNPNKMRSSTQRNQEENISRTRCVIGMLCHIRMNHRLLLLVKSAITLDKLVIKCKNVRL